MLPPTRDTNYGEHLNGQIVDKTGYEIVMAQVMVQWFLLYAAGTTPEELKQWILMNSPLTVPPIPTVKLMMDFFVAINVFNGSRDLVRSILMALSPNENDPFQNPWAGDIQNVIDTLEMHPVAGFKFAPYRLTAFGVEDLVMWTFKRAQENELKSWHFSNFVVKLDYTRWLSWIKKVLEAQTGLKFGIRTTAAEIESMADYQSQHLRYYLAACYLAWCCSYLEDVHSPKELAKYMG
jgi:hypothetical protein